MKVKCNRCGRNIGRNEHYCVFYARRTDGVKQDFVLCKECTTQLGEFMRIGMKEDAPKETAEQPVEEAFIN